MKSIQNTTRWEMELSQSGANRITGSEDDECTTRYRPSYIADEWAGEELGKYLLCDEIASGGMASVCLGQLKGAAGFTRIVAIKRLHARFTRDEEFVLRFKDEARLAARVLHPNVAQVFDLVEHDGELLLVMEYVHGVSLRAAQLDAGAGLPFGLISGLLVPVLSGLHAVHEAVDDDGAALGIVHRDFSPQNIVVSCEGHAKIVDFGIARAARKEHVTLSGAIGKPGFMSPEQVSGAAVDRRTDVFAAGVVLWEAITGRPLFRQGGNDHAATLSNVMSKPVPKPSSLRRGVPPAVDELVLCALERDREARFATALGLARALERALPPDSSGTMSEWLNATSAARLEQATRLLAKAKLRASRDRTVPPLRDRAPSVSELRVFPLLSSTPPIAESAVAVSPLLARLPSLPPVRVGPPKGGLTSPSPSRSRPVAPRPLLQTVASVWPRSLANGTAIGLESPQTRGADATTATGAVALTGRTALEPEANRLRRKPSTGDLLLAVATLLMFVLTTGAVLAGEQVDVARLVSVLPFVRVSRAVVQSPQPAQVAAPRASVAAVSPKIDDSDLDQFPAQPFPDRVETRARMLDRASSAFNRGQAETGTAVFRARPLATARVAPSSNPPLCEPPTYRDEDNIQKFKKGCI